MKISSLLLLLRAARLLEVDTGRVIAPGEILIEGERIAAVGSSVARPAGAEVIDLGDSTLLPGQTRHGNGRRGIRRPLPREDSRAVH
jgi:adenine deaminase